MREVAADAIADVPRSRYQGLFDSARAGIVISDATSRQIIDANSCFLALTGYARSEVIGHDLALFGLPSGALRPYRESDGVGERACSAGAVISTKSGQLLDVEVVSNEYLEDSQAIIQSIVWDVTERKSSAAQVREGEERYRALADAAPDDVFIVDRKYAITYANQYAMKKFASTGESMIGKTQAELFPPDAAVVLQTALEAAFETGESIYGENCLAFPDGDFWFSIWFVPLKKPDGEVYEVMGVARDISAFKQSQADLVEAQRFAQATVDALPDHIAVIDEHGIITSVNLAWCNFADANGFAGNNHGIGDDYIAISAADTDGEGCKVAAGISTILSGASDAFCLEYPCHSPTEERWFELNATRFAGAGPLQVVITHENVTRRTQAAARLRASEERSATAQRMAHLGNWELSLLPEAEVAIDEYRVSDEVFRIYGYEPGEIVASNENFLQAIHPDDRQDVAVTMFRAIDEQKGYSFDHRIHLPNGEERIVHQHGDIVCDASGQVVRMVGTVQDITDRKQAETELLFQKTLLEAQTEATLDGILIVSEFGRVLSYNQRFLRMWNLPADLALGDDDGPLLRAVLDLVVTPEQFMDRVAEIYANHDLRSQDELKLRDGQTFDRYSAPINTAGGTYCGRVWFFRDITERKRAEVLLLESRQRLALATESAHIGIWDWNIQSNQLVWDDQMYAFYGIPREDFGGVYAIWENGLHPEDRGRVLALVTTALSNGDDFRAQFRVVWPNGILRHIEAHSVIQRDAAGLPLRMIGVNWDITNHKDAEATLRTLGDELEARVQLRTSELEHSNAALQFQIAERETAEAETRNRVRQQAAVAELGREALTDADLDTLLQDATKLITATLNVECSAVVELLPGGSSLLVRAGTGWKRGIKGQRAPLEGNPKAAFILASTTPTIIANLGEEKRFDIPTRLLDHGIISGVAVVIGGEGRPFGFLDAHTTRRRLFTQDDVHFLQSVANVLAAATEQRRGESEIRELNTQLKETNERLRLENVDRQIALSNLHAVTVVLEQAKEDAEHARENSELANRAKSEFLSRMSHELRTPLNSIIGFGQILAMRNSDADSQQRDNIDQILSAGRHLLALINEVLDIARIEAGHLSLSAEPIAVDRLVQEVLDMVRPLARPRGISLFNNIRIEITEQYILADQQRVKQVLLNLLSNAVKYNRTGGTVTLLGEVYEGEPTKYNGMMCGGRLRLLVQDTGPGLKPDQIDRLFVPFERLGLASRDVEGSGIGLSLCRQLVEAMHGAIGVDSEPGQGCAFWVEFPILSDIQAHRAMSMVSPSADRSQKTTSVTDESHARTVLYIEDNLSNIRLIERVLDGFEPTVRLLSAMQGSLGLELALQHLPDIILLDVNLPDIMGETVLSRLKADVRTRNIPVVVLSADATKRQIENMLAAGATEYLTKPLDIKLFANVLRNCMAHTGAESD